MEPTPISGNSKATSGMNGSVSTLVQMRLQPRTIAKINHLVELTGITNKTQLIATSLDLAEIIIANVKNGGNDYIEKKDGTKELLKIVGI